MGSPWRNLLATPKHKILLHFDTEFVEDGRAAFPDVEFISVPRSGVLAKGTEGEALLTFAWGTENLADVVSRGVRWVHTIGPAHGLGAKLDFSGPHSTRRF